MNGQVRKATGECSSHALEVSDLRKTYGDTVAVDGLSFTVPRGTIFGLLGPNGAGKTTALECIEGLRQPDGGTISVMGIDPVSHPRRLWNAIGVQLQTSGLPETMTPREAVRFFSRYHGKQPSYGVIDRFGLSAKADTQYGALSVGQKRRLALALAVAHEPRLLFLDEPTAGLDVESRMELHAMMQELRQAGDTIVLATHDMAEAEKLCDLIAIIIAGKLAVVGTPAQITAAGDRRSRITVSSSAGALFGGRAGSRQAVPAGAQAETHSDAERAAGAHGAGVQAGESEPGGADLPDAVLTAVRDGYLHYHSENPARTVAALLRILEEENDELLDLRVERPSLEERFIEITRRNGK